LGTASNVSAWVSVSAAVRQARVADLLSSRPEASQIPYTVCAGQPVGFMTLRNVR